MTREEYFQKAKEAKQKFENALDMADKALKTFPKGEMGLTPDHVKNSPEFR